MKIQCNACEVAEASVLCCADEAALCRACDEAVHAANKLAGKHLRVPLTAASSSPVPKCDICQMPTGCFLCEAFGLSPLGQFECMISCSIHELCPGCDIVK